MKKQEMEEAAEFFDQNGGLIDREPRVNHNSDTWKAIKMYVEKEIAANYLPTLKNKGISHDDTQHARGGIEALERLLEFGGESIV